MDLKATPGADTRHGHRSTGRFLSFLGNLESEVFL